MKGHLHEVVSAFKAMLRQKSVHVLTSCTERDYSMRSIRVDRVCESPDKVEWRRVDAP